MTHHLKCWQAIACMAPLVLGACHSAPTRIYPLAVAQPASRATAPSPMLRVDSVHVPPDWDRIEILTPAAGGGLKINDLDRWSAPLAQVTRQVLSADLDARMPPGTVIYPHLPKSSDALGIGVDILAFTLSGATATMQVSWIITPAQQPETAKRSAATLTTPVTGTDPASVARAWSALVGEVAEHIAADAPTFKSPLSQDLFSRIQLNPGDRGFCSATVVPLGDKSLVFVSGEVGRDASGKVVSGGFEAEARQCFANIERTLNAAGATFKNVVRITAFVKDLADYPIYARVRTEVFGSDWPASASVGVADLLLGAKLEVDAIAVIEAR